MFTGIVAELGEVLAVEPLADEAARLKVRGPGVLADAGLGDSIAVNGVCLTVVTRDEASFTADVMRETLVRTSLGGLAPGSLVNLERPMPATGRFDGHIVQGHVDGVARVRHRRHSEHWDVVRFSLPDELARYVVEKGSITVDGVSLTVSAAGRDDGGDWFEVSLIPTTLARTTLGLVGEGEGVNLEVDVLAKYVERMLKGRED